MHSLERCQNDSLYTSVKILKHKYIFAMMDLLINITLIVAGYKHELFPLIILYDNDL